MSNYVLYHGNCSDGFGAAWVASKMLGKDTVFKAVNYGEALPAIPDKSNVYILDFSYPRDTLMALSKRCPLLVIDHHASAQKELGDLPFAIFDMKKSGAMLTWDYFNPGKNVPLLIQYIQDRDLWLWNMPASRTISAALRLEPQTFTAWDAFGAGLEDGDASEKIRHTGETANLVVDLAAAQQARGSALIQLAGMRVPAVNTQYAISETAHAILEKAPAALFAVVWFQRADGGFQYSLRSNGRVDVSVIAKERGGGGHPNAAGFEASHPPVYVGLKNV